MGIRRNQPIIFWFKSVTSDRESYVRSRTTLVGAAAFRGIPPRGEVQKSADPPAPTLSLKCYSSMNQSPRSLYFENSSGRIWEEPDCYLRLEYRPGPRELVQFRALLTHMGQALARRRWDKALIDQRAMAPLSPGEQAWMATEWLPRVVNESGYRYGAVLVAHDVFARLAMNELVFSTRGLPHTYRTFEAEETALGWLLKTPDN